MKLPEKQLRYIDRPEIYETYADSLGLSTFDGHSLRVELCVTRLDPPSPPKQPTGRKYPTCRLVLSPEASVELFNQLQQMIGVMQQQGLVVKNEPPKGGTPPAVH